MAKSIATPWTGFPSESLTPTTSDESTSVRIWFTWPEPVTRAMVDAPAGTAWIDAVPTTPGITSDVNRIV